MADVLSTPLNRDALQQFIDRQRIDAAILELDEHTASVADAARALNVGTDQIIKSLVISLTRHIPK